MGATSNTRRFDQWIRGPFVAMNTDLEERYFSRAQREDVTGVGDEVKRRLVEEGRACIVDLLREGNTDEGFDAGFDLLGNVGLYMAACRRHDLTEPSRERASPLKEASALALQLGASLGVTPRFATSHLATHNRAVDGRYKTFTSLEAERMFLELNTAGVLAYKAAADAVVRSLPLGISHPVSRLLFEEATEALERVGRHNATLFSDLDVDRFFYCVRPYYKPYRVGRNEYRGANAGDFSGINELDLLLGLCRADDPYYSQLLVDKLLYMMPDDQLRLRDCMRRESLMDQFLRAADSEAAEAEWLRPNLAAFVRVCEAHGRAAAQHHDQLVERFIVRPADDLPAENLTHITASGPPLHVLISALEKLRDLRLAADVAGIPTRHDEMARLRSLATAGAN